MIAPGRTREGIAAALRTSVLAPFVALEGRAASVRAAVAARHDVLVTRGQVASQALRVRAVADENVTLRQLLGLSARLEDGFVPAEVLPSRGSGDVF
jgi:rod shape-determining protein MreC